MRSNNERLKFLESPSLMLDYIMKLKGSNDNELDINDEDMERVIHTIYAHLADIF